MSFIRSTIVEYKVIMDEEMKIERKVKHSTITPLRAIYFSNGILSIQT